MPPPDTCTWATEEVAGSPPSLRRYASAVAYSGRVYLFGGQTGSSAFHNDVYVYDPAARTWTRAETTGPTPGQRAGHSAVLVGNEMFVYGGFLLKQALADMHVLNLDTLEWRAIAPPGDAFAPGPRYHHQAWLHGDSMMVFGGAITRSKYSSELLRFSLTDHSWAVVPSQGEAPSERAGGLLVPLRDGRALLYGGFAGDGGFDYYSDAFFLQLDADGAAQWTEIDLSGACPGTARPLSGELVRRPADGSEYVVVFGGFDGRTPSSALYALDLATRVWSQVGMWAAMSEGASLSAMLSSTKGFQPVARYGHGFVRIDADAPADDDQSAAVFYVLCGAGSLYLNDVVKMIVDL